MAQKKPELRLHEQILLLALRDEKGTVAHNAGWYSLALGGAMLAELLLDGCIKVTEDKKKHVEHVKTIRLGDEVLDEALDRIQRAKRRKSAASWVSTLAGMKRLRHRVAERLCQRGILKDDEDKVMLIFRRKIYPTLNPAPEARLIAELRHAIFGGSADVEPRTAVLVALANATGVLRVPFTRKELKPHKARLKQFVEGGLIAGAATDAVQAAQAAQAAQVAVMAAISASIAASTAASSG